MKVMDVIDPNIIVQMIDDDSDASETCEGANSTGVECLDADPRDSKLLRIDGKPLVRRADTNQSDQGSEYSALLKNTSENQAVQSPKPPKNRVSYDLRSPSEVHTGSSSNYLRTEEDKAVSKNHNYLTVPESPGSFKAPVSLRFDPPTETHESPVFLKPPGTPRFDPTRRRAETFAGIADRQRKVNYLFPHTRSPLSLQKSGMSENAGGADYRVGHRMPRRSESQGQEEEDEDSVEEALLTPERVRRGDGYETSDTFSDGAVSEDDDQSSRRNSDLEAATPINKVPMRSSVRKKAVGPLREETNKPLDRSPSASVASFNSISSLLNEKIMMNLPRVMKRSKSPSEYKLRSFVVFLLLVISLLVGFAHVLYQQKILQKEYFERLRFNRDARHIRVHSLDGTPLALGYLGVGLPPAEKVYPCLEEDEKSDGSVCMEWIHKARLYLKPETTASDLRCYRLTWTTLLGSSYDPTDCFEEGGTYGHWYGGGRTLGMSWPVELGRVEMSPFVTGYIGRQRWGATLRRYFLNSRGVAILVSAETSLFVSINDLVNPNKLCLQARRDDFAYYKQSHRPSQLNYSICVSSNIKTLHSQLSQSDYGVDPASVDSKQMDSLLTEPVYQIASQDQHLNESTVQNYTENIIALGFLKQGHVLLNEHWQPHVGDLTFDHSRFATMKETINIIHRRGFRITLSVQPFIQTESVNFAHTVRENMLITERGSDKRIPALTRYKSLLSAGMFDVTFNKTVHWLQSKLRSLVAEYNIDSFYLDLGTAYDLPRHYKFKRNLSNPDEFKTEFVNQLLGSINISGLSSAIVRPPAPVFVSLPVLPSTWESLQLIIPTTLTYGIIGYPFLLPGPVGGDYSLESTDPTKESWLPDKELYIRWLQLATFLPVIRYSHLPSEYTTDKMVLDLAKNLTTLRQTKINDLLLKYKVEALKTGAPLIRPLWMLDPSDAACYTVSNEFLIGEELLVAPILNPGTFERELYLPAGAWRDGIDGKQRKGPMLIPNYRVALNEIAFFRKIPDTSGLKRMKEN